MAGKCRDSALLDCDSGVSHDSAVRPPAYGVLSLMTADRCVPPSNFFTPLDPPNAPFVKDPSRLARYPFELVHHNPLTRISLLPSSYSPSPFDTHIMAVLRFDCRAVTDIPFPSMTVI